ncbi:MAG: hypothetical protein KJO81_03745 [Gammaproteobacteria bacterium]|nr:hypothetical protein [Gammaproteobacteria bacterium]
MKKNLSNLIQHENNWITEMGASFPGERVVFRGKDVFQELSKFSWMQVLLFGITGREFSEDQARLFEGIWVISASYPDPRIWNNRVAALAGTVRSTGSLAISASLAVSEATNYGQRPLIKAIDFLIDTCKRIKAGEGLENIVLTELKSKRMLAGYGRPIVNKDERIEPLLELSQKLGYKDGEHALLALEIEQMLEKYNYPYKLNAAGMAAALAADQGLAPNEFYHLMSLCFTAGFHPCYIDTQSSSEGVFFPLRCEFVSYSGENAREWGK